MLVAIVVAGMCSVLTDWLFLSVLFREARSSYPEIWWPTIRDGEMTIARIWTVALGFVTAAGVVLLCAMAGAAGLLKGLEIGALAFLAGPAVMLLTAMQFVKMDLWVLVGHLLTYLSRMLIAGAIAGWIMAPA